MMLVPSALIIVLLTFTPLHVFGREPVKPTLPGPTLPTKHVKRHRETWHEFHLPSPIHDQIILSVDKAEFKNHHDEDTRAQLHDEGLPNLACDEACMDMNVKNITADDAEKSLLFEKIDEHGTKTVVRLRADDQFVKYINSWSYESDKLNRQQDGSHNRRKREVYQFDTRFPVEDPQVYEISPFSAAVVLSTGCSGILIGPKYVLTAAHCIHNGKKYVDKLKNVKAGFRRDRVLEPDDDVADAFYWIRATEAFLPYEWTSSGKQKLLPVEQDYAVIKLKRESDRPYLNISVGTPENVAEGTRIHIPAFDKVDDPTLIYRFCRVADGTQEVMYQVCDSEEGAIGAGVYVRRWDREAKKWTRKVIAIYGGHARFYQGHRNEDYNVALRITPLKFAQICFWTTGSFGGCKG